MWSGTLSVGALSCLSSRRTHRAKVDEVVRREVRADGPLQPLAGAREVAPDECSADDQLDRLRDLPLVARGGGVRALESPLGGLRGAEAIEDAGEHSLDARARVGVRHVAGLDQLFERLELKGVRAAATSPIVARHVTRR